MVREHERGNTPEYKPTDGLTVEQDKQLEYLLSLWGGGTISTPVFTELARMIPMPIVEVVIFRMNEEEILETLLIPRPQDDIVWPGMFHTPGTAIRRADYFRDDRNPLNGAFERVQWGELNRNFLEDPMFAGRLHRLSERGPDVSEIYIAKIGEGDLEPGQIWYPVDELADNPLFIQSQLGHVRMAAEFYLRTKES